MTLEAIDHVDLVVSSLERSLPFYEGLLRPLGYVDVGDIVGEEGERVVYLSRHLTDGSIGLRQRHSGLDTADRYAIGLHHLAFSAVSRQTVEEIADRARDAGAEIESGPREYDYTPGYYAVFIHDPDGIKLEFVHRPEERDLALRVSALEARIAELEDEAS
ncbi:MAG: Glyoxalase/bleomycin resistance protein/dioxygenase [Solirubrobacterales bacterium]|nr:Glyoxalase/bleomycin resistance protein/dioxygenase [Solirubrobacterales bacterium]